MGGWREFVEDVTERVLTVAIRQSQAVQHNNGARESGRIERLCREVGWKVDEYANGGIRLDFSTANGEKRFLLIQDGNGPLVTLSAFSCVTLNEQTVRLPEIMAYLLQRNLNDEAIGMWGMHANEANRITLHVVYRALGDGLEASAFKFICESLVNEGLDFDARLREAGLSG